jgi:hypothetical protein
MIHTILFTREGEPDTNTALTLESRSKNTEFVFEAFHRAVAAYLNSTEMGTELLEESSDDFNIGDFANYDVTITRSPEFCNHMAACRVKYLGLAPADLRVTYDRLLAQPENYYPV